MANPEQLEYLQDSADDWNIYRREHAIMQTAFRQISRPVTGPYPP